jgi:putative phage-type endonuclease
MSDLNSQIHQLKLDLAQIQQWAQKSDDWLNQKRRLLTATEIAVLKNAHIFQTLNQLYDEKCHPERQKAGKTSSPSTEWGERYEPIAKVEMQKRHSDWVEVLELGLATHPIHTFLGASPDGLVLVNNNGQLELWLIEIKCPYSRKITKQMPYQYWLQIQTQLYVWTALLAQFGWKLHGCIYNENEFTELDAMSTLTQYWEHVVYLDAPFYEQNLMPEITQFWSCIKAYFRNRKRKHSQIETETPSLNRKKLRALTVDDLASETLIDGLYMSYLQSPHVITQKQYRNYINQDRLLDWLNVYGDEFGFPKDVTSDSDFKNYLGRQTSQLHELIFNIIQKTTDKGHCVKIGQTYPYLPEGSDSHFYDIHSNTKGLAQAHLRDTINSMKAGIPVILNGYLYHPQLQTFGHYPILVKVNFLKKLFPIAYKKLADSGLAETNEDCYTFIQIRYSKLKLCAKGLYLLNVGSQKFYKLEQAHLHEVLRFYQPECQSYDRKEMASLIMGRKSTSTSKGKTYENYNAVTSFGVIDFVDRDKEALEDFYAAREWLHDLISEGRSWSIDPPSHDFLYPNCKNTENGSWGHYKMALAKKNKDLTLLWYVGQAERQRLWDSEYLVRQWPDLDITKLKFNDHIKSIIGNMIESQQTNQIINMSALKAKLLELKTPIEFYLDFEFVPDLVDDFKGFPMSSVDKYIYMIGNVSVDHSKNRKQYYNYLVNRLEKKQEQVMLKTFLSELKDLNENLPQITIYHWGTAEKSQLTNYLESQNLMGDDFETGQMAQKLKMVDLCELFKNYEVTLPNCFEYGLKQIARVFYENRWIQTYWSEGLNGEDAMVAAIDAEVDCQKGLYDNLTQNPTMQRYIRYNYADCKIMEEIVTYVRSCPDTPISIEEISD